MLAAAANAQKESLIMASHHHALKVYTRLAKQSRSAYW